jgi:hypothetical protein
VDLGGATSLRFTDWKKCFWVSAATTQLWVNSVGTMASFTFLATLAAFRVLADLEVKAKAQQVASPWVAGKAKAEDVQENTGH